MANQGTFTLPTPDITLKDNAGTPRIVGPEILSRRYKNQNSNICWTKLSSFKSTIFKNSNIWKYEKYVW